MSVLVIMEQRAGVLNRMSLETLTGGAKVATGLGIPLEAAVIGQGVAEVAGTVAAYGPTKTYMVEHELLAEYTPDGFAKALDQLIRAKQPQVVLFPHTYQVRDFAPKLVTRFGRALVSDVVDVKVDNSAVHFVRQLFQGKLNADFASSGDGAQFVSLQAGAFRAAQTHAEMGTVEAFAVELVPSDIRSKAEAPFREAQRSVDLSSAEMIVSVGRGIKEKENLPLVEALAEALGAELAASRPICDNGWLPMERQVGSSGQTVAPKVYFAVGISGAIQHLVGMKGARTVVAINSDENAPIFEVADYGIVGDLFQVVPALTAEIKKVKA